MFRKVLILTAIVLVFSASGVQADVTHSTWVGGPFSEWGNANNWNPSIVPDNAGGNTFNVTINAGTGEVSIGLQHWRTIDQLDSYGNVELATWISNNLELTLEDPNGLTNHGELEVTGWDLDITGNITNQGGARFDSHAHSLDINGLITNSANATIAVYWSTWVFGDVQNAGTIIVPWGVGILGVHGDLLNTGLIQMFGGVCGSINLFDNDANGVIIGFGTLFSEEMIQNKGKIHAYGGSLAVSIEGALINNGILGNSPLSSLHIKPAVDVNNNGTIEVNAGGGVAFDCNLVNEPNGVIQLLGGTLAATTITQTANANFTSFGSITGNVIIEPDGIIKLTGPTNIVGDVTIEHNAVMEISDGQTLITGQTTNNGIIHVVNGNVIFQGGYSGSGVVQKD